MNTHMSAYKLTNASDTVVFTIARIVANEDFIIVRFTQVQRYKNETYYLALSHRPCPKRKTTW